MCREAVAVLKQKMHGKPVLDENGKAVTIPGSLKSVKAIGWYIEEYGIAQISMNLTNIGVTPLHIAFDEVCRKADARGIRVTGSELVGLVPLQSMIAAGKYFLEKQNVQQVSFRKELVRIAIRSMGLEELAPFKPEERIIEYLLKDKKEDKLISMSLTDFADETASESPAPGGGSIAAYVGAPWVFRWQQWWLIFLHTKRVGMNDGSEFSDWADKGQQYKNELIRLVDADTKAFNRIMTAMGLSNSTDAEKQIRKQAIQEATKFAIEVPFKVMQLAYESMEVIKAMAEIGNPNSVSDAGVGALCAGSAVMGSFYLNVRINAAGYGDKDFVEDIISKGKEIETKTIALEAEILKIVNEKIGFKY